ncbi:glutathione transferase Ure2p5 [Irpex lacteus]|nr:glutathione transferase Ure2p5 [Irpex lacteus]
MSHGKQFTLFSHVFGPNGWKVAMVMEELGLTYQETFVNFKNLEQKDPTHTQYNPNGRIPTLIDHWNNDFVVWESCAILIYLVEKYDPEHIISAEYFEDKMHQNQWLFFQASGQGPYFGQAGWFKHVNPSPHLPEVIERYQKEIVRVLGVLESVLSKQQWLVAGKCTIADISFVIWNIFAETILVVDYNDFNLDRDFPAVGRWHRELKNRPAIARTLARRDNLKGK